MYELQAVHYNFFVLSAVAVLYLAVRHGPLTFNNAASDIFRGLEILKTCSSSGMASERLCEKVQILENAMMSLGYNRMQINGDIYLQPTNTHDETSCSSENCTSNHMEGDSTPEGGLFSAFLSHNLITVPCDVDLVDVLTNPQQQWNPWGNEHWSFE